jgi:hypothetical protein
VARWCRGALHVNRPFRLAVPEYHPVPRLHLPLVEPDVRVSRIRLSDKVSHRRTREVAGSALEPEQPESPQVRFRREAKRQCMQLATRQAFREQGGRRRRQT